LQTLVAILENVGWRNVATHQTRHGNKKETKATQKTPFPETVKRNMKKIRKKTRTRNRTKTGKKHEAIKIPNLGLWLVKNLITLCEPT